MVTRHGGLPRDCIDPGRIQSERSRHRGGDGIEGFDSRSGREDGAIVDADGKYTDILPTNV